jgi:hypothetical protein
MIPRLSPIMAAWVRSLARNLPRMFFTRPFTVSSVIESCAAISLLAFPPAIRLAEGNLTEARLQAERFLSVTLTTAERTWQVLAWEANARVALAELDAPRAQECIAKASSTMEGFEVPLASWRVHASAFEFCRNAGDRASAERHRALSRETILKLANSLPAEEPLRHIFLASPMVRRILGDAETREARVFEAAH